MSDAEINDNVQAQGEIFYYLHAYAGAKIPEGYPHPFVSLGEDKEALALTPRGIYLLDIPAIDATNLQEQYGIIVQSCDSISDNILKGGAHRELPKDLALRNGADIGWKCLFDFSLPPSNTIVITDDWLFKNEEMDQIVGQGNLVSFLDAVLPQTLAIDYHVLVITDDHGRSHQRCEKLVLELKNSISALRPYPITFEFIFTETIHKRKAILNYMSITCDKGFAMFRLSDLETVRDDNDFRYEKAFNRWERHEGDTVFYSDTLLLRKIKNKCASVKDYIDKRHQDPNRRLLGDISNDYSINNRLINDV